ncbi:hypothetical protein V8F06_013888, partial [Rhypophila decipiens]
KKKARLLQAKARKRRRTMLKKADELRQCHARVYLVMEMNGRFYEYKSESTAQWPPSTSAIDKSYPLPMRYTP